MIDFELTEEQKMLQRTAHEFAEKEMRPIAREIDADGTRMQPFVPRK